MAEREWEEAHRVDTGGSDEPAEQVAAPTMDLGMAAVLDSKDRILERARQKARRIEEQAQARARQTLAHAEAAVADVLDHTGKAEVLEVTDASLVAAEAAATIAHAEERAARIIADAEEQARKTTTGIFDADQLDDLARSAIRAAEARADAIRSGAEANAADMAREAAQLRSDALSASAMAKEELAKCEDRSRHPPPGSRRTERAGRRGRRAQRPERPAPRSPRQTLVPPRSHRLQRDTQPASSPRQSRPRTGFERWRRMTPPFRESKPRRKPEGSGERPTRCGKPPRRRVSRLANSWGRQPTRRTASFRTPSRRRPKSGCTPRLTPKSPVKPPVSKPRRSGIRPSRRSKNAAHAPR